MYRETLLPSCTYIDILLRGAKLVQRVFSTKASQYFSLLGTYRCLELAQQQTVAHPCCGWVTGGGGRCASEGGSGSADNPRCRAGGGCTQWTCVLCRAQPTLSES
jgi:hypothetical protein